MRRAVPLLLIAAALALSCAGPSQEPPPVPTGAIPAGTTVGSASIQGRVLFTGEAPEPETISMRSDAGCARHGGEGNTKEDLVVASDGAVKNAFVHVASGLGDRAFAPPSEPVTLDQRGCIYRPHVTGVQVGQPLKILNSDPTLHNVHTVSESNKPFNFGMSVEGQQAVRYFHNPEIMVRAKCDVHPWMSSYIGVVAHPFFAVTGEDGSYELAGLPAGTYEIEVWHEKLGTLSATVTLSDDEAREVPFAFPG